MTLSDGSSIVDSPTLQLILEDVYYQDKLLPVNKESNQLNNTFRAWLLVLAPLKDP